MGTLSTQHMIHKMLIADDEEDLLLLIKMKMKKEGYQVQTSQNGTDIFSMVASNRPDIILLDISMQGVNGGDICKKLKSDDRTAEIPIIMFSANQNIEEITEACGADGCLGKPFDSQAMKKKVAEVLSRKT